MTAPIIDEMKKAGLIRSPEDERKARAALKSELERRKSAAYYLDPGSAEASFAFFRDFVVPAKWRDGLAEMHREGARFITDPVFDQKLALWPRETLKTSQFTVGEAARLAIGDPNLRFLLIHHKHKKSMKFLTGIRGLLQKKSIVDTFGWTLPEKMDKYRPDNNEELTLATRMDLTIREATFTTGGVDKTDTSGHFDFIICDDLITENNSEDAEQLEKPMEYWRGLLDLLDKAVGKMWCIGTRYHPLDLYGTILDEFTDPECRVYDGAGTQVRALNHVEKCSCYFDLMLRELRNEDGSFVYPAHFTEKVAKRLLDQKGPIQFAKQYNNNPIDPLTCWLKAGEVRAMYCHAAEWQKLRDDGMLIIIQVVDPAESKKKKSAYTAIVTVGVHKITGVWYVMGATQARVETAAFINMIFAEHQKFSPYAFGMESNTRKALKYVLEERMQSLNYFFSIEDVSPRFNAGPDDKKRRFKQNVVPLCQYGRIRIDDSLREAIQFFVEVPNARYWDIGDCLSYVPDLAPVIAEKPKDVPEFVQPERILLWPECGY